VAALMVQIGPEPPSSPRHSSRQHKPRPPPSSPASHPLPQGPSRANTNWSRPRSSPHPRCARMPRRHRASPSTFSSPPSTRAAEWPLHRRAGRRGASSSPRCALHQVVAAPRVEEAPVCALRSLRLRRQGAAATTGTGGQGGTGLWGALSRVSGISGAALARERPGSHVFYRHLLLLISNLLCIFRVKNSSVPCYQLRMTILPIGTVPAGTVPAWAGYGHTFISTGSTHTLPVNSWVGHRYSLLPAGILIPYPFILTCESRVSQ
jgi:hypothetical protein